MTQRFITQLGRHLIHDILFLFLASTGAVIAIIRIIERERRSDELAVIFNYFKLIFRRKISKKCLIDIGELKKAIVKAVRR